MSIFDDHSDILRHVFSFFLSDDRVVDGTSLRASGLVCREWHQVVNSKSLWEIVRSSSRELDDGFSSHGYFSRDHEMRSVYESLSIQESDTSSTHDSLIGFRRQRSWRCVEGLYHAVVEERTTGKQLIFEIGKDGKMPRRLVQSMYINHLLGRETHLSSFRGRYVHWRGVDTECRQISIADLRRIEGYRNTDKLWLRALVHLEKEDKVKLGLIYQREAWSSNRIWSEVVDWITEMAQCFELEDRSVYQSLKLLQICSEKFADVQERRLSSEFFQLLAGVCLTIACKSNNTDISEGDLCHSMDNIFDVTIIRHFERYCLLIMCKDLAYPTPLEFLLAFSGACGIKEDGTLFNTYLYFLEQSTRTPAYRAFLPSIIAGSCVVLANFASERRMLWPKILEATTGLLLSDITGCACQLSEYFENLRRNAPNALENMTHYRFGKKSRQCVNGIAVPYVASERTLLDLQAQAVA